jgi:hypothetical protein
MRRCSSASTPASPTWAPRWRGRRWRSSAPPAPQHRPAHRQRDLAGPGMLALPAPAHLRRQVHLPARHHPGDGARARPGHAGGRGGA